MAGDGPDAATASSSQPLPSGPAGGGLSATDFAESQYAKAKTSVWWDIENCNVPKLCDPHSVAQSINSALVKMNYCGAVSISAYGDTNRLPASVQHALSSTGVSLNHVPAGVKDASDKKILVDMLFWAVDNPAPANYLLISGDRDFSNALHQLRMRRYNILLAQPQQASAPLVAAAKSVWLWTGLLAGGLPLNTRESSQLTNGGSMTKNMNSDTPLVSNFESLSLGNQKFINAGKVGDSKYKSKSIWKNPNEPNMWRAIGVTAGIQESKNNEYLQQSEQVQTKNFKKAPHEFFGAADGAVIPSSGSAPNFFQASSGNDTTGNSHSSHLWRPNNLPVHSSFGRENILLPMSYNPTCDPENMLPPKFYYQGFRPMPPRADGPRYPCIPNTDVGALDYVNYSQNSSGFPLQNGEGLRQGSLKPFNTDTGNFVWGTSGSPQPSEYVQSLINVVLFALNTLRTEKIMPVEANITDCIRHRDHKFQNADVRKALDSAIEQNMVVRQKLGAVHFYVGKNDRLWKCVNPIAGDPNQYPKTIWDGIHMFLTSSDGRSAIMASQSRYEAASILKKGCLEDLALGDVLQILNMISTIKKWIQHHPSGWQPITITISEASSDGTSTDP